MEYLKLYELGKKVEVKPTKNGTDCVVLIYNKGRDYALQYIKGKRKNISLTKKDLYRLAGVEVISDIKDVEVCCYAKVLYEKIEAERRKHAGTVFAGSVAEELDKDLKKKPITYFLSASSLDLQKPEYHAIIGAKKFTSYRESVKVSMIEKVISEEQRS